MPGNNQIIEGSYILRKIESLKANSTFANRIFRLNLFVPVVILSSYWIYNNLKNTDQLDECLQDLYEFESTADYINNGAVIYYRKGKKTSITNIE